MAEKKEKVTAPTTPTDDGNDAPVILASPGTLLPSKAEPGRIVKTETASGSVITTFM